MKLSSTKLKILLIQPISMFTTALDFKNTVLTHLLELGTKLQQHFSYDSKVKVEVINLIDEDIHKPKKLAEYGTYIQSIKKFFLRYNDDGHLIFGISCFSSNYYISSIVLASILRKIYPKSLICVGGYQVNYFPEEFIFPHAIEGRLISDKLFDYVFLGESDQKFPELIASLVSANRIFSRKKEKCHVIQCGLVDDLESLPPIDYSLAKTPNSPFIFIPIYFSKGCPFNCAFCGDFRNFYPPKRRWRMISPKTAFLRLQNLIKYYDDITFQVQIMDPLWTYPDWRIKFYELMYEHKTTQDIWAEVRVDQFSSRETQYLKDLSFTLAFGLESGSPKMLRIMKKTNNPTKYLEKFSSVVTQLDNADVYVISNLLFGHPGETLLTMRQTMDYVEQIQQNVGNFIPSISKYMLIPGSDIYNNQRYYVKAYNAHFYLTHYWTIPKCSVITSSMVDPSDNFGYMDIITELSQWIPDFYVSCIKRFKKKPKRDFIYQRYLNYMVLGPRMYWKNQILRDYNEFGDIETIKHDTSTFWKDLY